MDLSSVVRLRGKLYGEATLPDGIRCVPSLLVRSAKPLMIVLMASSIEKVERHRLAAVWHLLHIIGAFHAVISS